MNGLNYWKETAPSLKTGDSITTLAVEADVAIIGAGIAGLSAAWWLNQRGVDAVVLEKEEVGAGASGASGGMLAFQIVKGLEPTKIKEFYDLTKQSFSLMKELVRTYNLDCWFEQHGSLFVAIDQSCEKILEEYNIQKQLGISCDFLEKNDLEKIINIQSAVAAVRRSGDGAINPYRFCQELAGLLNQREVKIFENAEVKNISQENNKVLLHTKHGTVIASNCFIMADGYFPICGFGDRKLKRSKVIYVIATEPLTPKMKSAVGWQGRESIWNDNDDFDYFRILPDDRILFGTSTEIKEPQLPKDIPQEEGYARFLEKRFHQVFPQLKGINIQYFWGGLIGLRDGSLPFTGKLDNRIWGAGGYNGDGLLMGFLAGKMLSEAFLRKQKIPSLLKPF